MIDDSAIFEARSVGLAPSGSGARMPCKLPGGRRRSRIARSYAATRAHRGRVSCHKGDLSGAAPMKGAVSDAAPGKYGAAEAP